MSLLHRVFLPALVTVGLGLLIACGSSSNNTTPPPSGGFSNTNFNGTYTFAISGTDSSGGALAIVGSIAACGCSAGTISAGTVDLSDTSGTSTAVAVVSSASHYSVSQSGIGTLVLNFGTSVPPYEFAFTLTDAAHGLISEYDQNGTGSGTIDLQASSIALSNAYAFSLSGSDLKGDPIAEVGAFTLSSSGAAGLVDGNDAGTADLGSPANGLGLTGGMSVGTTGTTPGTATLSSGFGSFTFDVYAIDATHLKLIESDGGAVQVGDVFSQPSATIPAGNLSFTMAGFDSAGNPLAVGGTIASNGTANFSPISEDFNDDGTVDNGSNPPAASQISGSTFVAAPSGNTNGRVLVSMASGFVGGTNFAAYPYNGGVLMLEVDTGVSAGITAGTAMTQNSPAGVVASQGYAVNLTGADIVNGTELDQIAQFNTKGSSLSGTIYYNDFGVPNSPSNYNIASSSNYTSGTTGDVVLNFNGGSEAGLYYGVDGATSLVLGADNSDVSIGLIEQQGSPSSTADVAQRHLAMIKAAARARAAKKKKQQ
jgi:hypothetical protein